MQPLRKISSRTVYGGRADIVKAVMADQEKRVPIMRVIGRATDIKKGKGRRVETDEVLSPDEMADTKDAPWKGLVGEFKATNLDTGEEFYSGVAFFPEFALDMIAGKLGGDVTEVEFGIDIFAKYQEDSATLYVYEADFLSAMGEDDYMKALTARFEQQKPLAQITNAGDEKESAE